MNANDLACLGATARWMMITALCQNERRRKP